jgi:aminomethyltransferase
MERGIPREGYVVARDGQPVGYVASGAYSPTFRKGLATAFIPPELAAPDTVLEVIIRDKPAQARVVNLPFYRKQTKAATRKQEG